MNAKTTLLLLVLLLASTALFGVTWSQTSLASANRLQPGAALGGSNTFIQLPGAPVARAPQRVGALAATELKNTADLLSYNGDFQAAIATYQQSIDAAPGTQVAQESMVGLSRIAIKSKDYRLATATLEQLQKANPTGEIASQMLFLLGSTRTELHAPDLALQAYQEYVKTGGPLAPYAYLGIADIFTQQKQYKDAIDALNQIKVEDASNGMMLQVRRRLGENYAAVGDTTNAVNAYQQAVPVAQDSYQRADLLSSIATLYGNAGKTDAALSAWQNIVSGYPLSKHVEEAADAVRQLAGYLDSYSVGMVDFYKGDYAAASKALAWYLDNNPQGGNRAQAAYYRALSLYRQDQVSDALATWQDFVQANPNSDLVEAALWRSAMSLEDLGRTQEADGYLWQVGTRFPHGDYGDQALFKLGLHYFQGGRWDDAVATWTALTSPSYGSDIRSRAYFWIAKTRQIQGNNDQMMQYLAALRQEPENFYTLQADQRTGQSIVARVTGGKTPEAAKAAFADWLGSTRGTKVDVQALSSLDPSLAQDANFRRGQALLAVGESTLARGEFEAMSRRWNKDTLLLYQLSRWLQDHGQYPLSVSQGWDLWQRLPAGVPTYAVDLLRYPVPYGDLVLQHAAQQKLDPRLILAVMRQESRFQPDVGSPVGAQGLTQVMPATGQGIASKLNRPDFTVADLRRPLVSIEFGTWYMKEQLSGLNQNIFLALAAYNAGTGNAERWARNAAGWDNDLLAEIIDFPETHTYVNIVYENYLMYLALYPTDQDLKAASTPPAP